MRHNRMIAYDELTLQELEELEAKLNEELEAKLNNVLASLAEKKQQLRNTPEWHELQGIRFEITRRYWPL